MRNHLTFWLGLAVIALGLSCGEKENPMGEGLVDAGLLSRSDSLLECAITEATSFQFHYPCSDEACERGPGGSAALVLGSGYGYRARIALSFEGVAVDTSVVVDSAWVRLRAARALEGPPMDLTIHALVDTLIESQVFYGDSLAFDATPLPASFTYADDGLRIDLTEVVADWRTTDSMRGLVLASHDPGPSFAVFHSYESVSYSDTASVRPTVFIYQRPKGDTTVTFRYSEPQNDTYFLWWDPEVDSLSVAEGRLTIGKGFATRSLLKADVGAIPAEATINRAQLILRVDASQSAFDTLQVVTHGVDGEWMGAETAFHSTALGLGWVFPDIDSAVVNVTTLVQMWTGGLDDNDGLLLKCYGETDNVDFVRFFDLSGPGSLTPSLIVEYSMPPPAWFRE